MAVITKIFSISVLLFLLSGALFQIINGAYIWYDTGDKEPLIENTLGILFASDHNIYKNINDLVLSEDKKYESDEEKENYQKYLRMEIIKNIFILLMLFYFFFIVFRFLLGLIGKKDPTSFIFLIILTIGIMALMEFFYIMVANKELVFPFRGIFNLIKNWQVLFGVK